MLNKLIVVKNLSFLLFSSIVAKIFSSMLKFLSLLFFQLCNSYVVTVSFSRYFHFYCFHQWYNFQINCKDIDILKSSVKDMDFFSYSILTLNAKSIFYRCICLHKVNVLLTHQLFFISRYTFSYTMYYLSFDDLKWDDEYNAIYWPPISILFAVKYISKDY